MATVQLQPPLTVNETAEFLSVAPSSVYKLVNDGKLRAVRIGSTIRITPQALAAFLNGDEA